MTLVWIIGFVLFGGTANAFTSQRIVGGVPTTIEKYPFMVQVEFYGLAGMWSQRCAGSILTSRHILSAAQCFDGMRSDPVYRRIRAGTTYRCSGGEIFYVARAVNHPSYRGRGMEGDISVVQLTVPMPSTPNIQQASIAMQGTVVPQNIPVVLAGWGMLYQGGPSSEMLHEVTVYTINNEICAQRYKEYQIPLIITKNMICSGVLDVGGRDACDDDAGGPMYYSGIVIGVISGGHYCANDTYPGISTSIGSYTNWIVANAV